MTPRLVAIHVQALCTGQRITKETFTGNAGVKFAPAHYKPFPFCELKTTYLIPGICSLHWIYKDRDDLGIWQKGMSSHWSTFSIKVIGAFFKQDHVAVVTDIRKEIHVPSNNKKLKIGL